MPVLVSHSIQGDNKPGAGVVDMYTFMQVNMKGNSFSLNMYKQPTQ